MLLNIVLHCVLECFAPTIIIFKIYYMHTISHNNSSFYYSVPLVCYKLVNMVCLRPEEGNYVT